MQYLGRENDCVDRRNILGALTEPLMAHISMKSCYIKQSNKSTCPTGFLCVLFTLGQPNEKIYITVAWILPKVEKPDCVLWYYPQICAVHVSVLGQS